MALTPPDWLHKHGATLTPGSGGHSWVIYFGGKPEYVITEKPVAGKHGCSVMQTVNGRHIECAGAFPTVEEAVGAGLEALRKALGW